MYSIIVFMLFGFPKVGFFLPLEKIWGLQGKRKKWTLETKNQCNFLEESEAVKSNQEAFKYCN